MVVPIYRIALAQDLPALMELEAHYMAELEPGEFEGWKACEAVHRKRMEDMLMRTFVVEQSEEVLGYCYWGLRNDKAHIFNIYVHPDFRRYGFAQCLLERVEEDICKKGFRCWTHCPVKTQGARVFTEQLGYRLKCDDGQRLHLIKEVSSPVTPPL